MNIRMELAQIYFWILINFNYSITGTGTYFLAFFIFLLLFFNFSPLDPDPGGKISTTEVNCHDSSLCLETLPIVIGQLNLKKFFTQESSDPDPAKPFRIFWFGSATLLQIWPNAPSVTDLFCVVSCIVVDPNTLNLDADSGFWPNLDTDPGPDPDPG